MLLLSLFELGQRHVGQQAKVSTKVGLLLVGVVCGGLSTAELVVVVAQCLLDGQLATRRGARVCGRPKEQQLRVVLVVVVVVLVVVGAHEL